MKKLLLLTDFTANAAHAAGSARQLGAQLKTDLLLYHSIQYVPIVPDLPGSNMITETNESLFKDSRLQLGQAAEALSLIPVPAERYQPQITCETGEGSLVANVRELTGNPAIRLVVMGGRSGGALDHLLGGSETTAVINASQKPVLVIPVLAELSLVKKIVFASDFQEADNRALDVLTELAQTIGIHLEVVHIIKPGSVVTDIENEIAFRKRLNQLDPTAVSYQQITGDDISHLLETHCQQNGPALLAMTHQRHGLLSALFGRSESKKMLQQADLAVLIFPPDTVMAE